jgi:hypothetical protein
VNGGPVARLAEQAVAERDREVLVEAFVAAARFGEALELPFAAAEQLGLDVSLLVDEAAQHLYEDEEAILRAYEENG